MKEYRGRVDGEGLLVCVLVSRFNEEYGQLLLRGATAALRAAGVAEENLEMISVPGAFELAGAAAFRIRQGGLDAVIALGAVIRGETTHYDFVAGECARGIAELSRGSDIPVVFGVLTTENDEQALERAHPDRQDKGGEVARAALEMAHLYRDLSRRAETTRG